MNIKKEIGEKIKKIRKNKGLTQEKLSEMIDITPRNLCMIEVGANFPKPETLEKILIALDITTEELFSNNHLQENSILIENIKNDIKEIESNKPKLQAIYKIVNCIKNL